MGTQAVEVKPGTIRVKCVDCDHVYEVPPARFDENSGEGYYGSDLDFCVKCDGTPEVIGVYKDGKLVEAPEA